MKINQVICVCFFCLVAIMTFTDCNAKEVNIHPTFKALLIGYPRDKQIIRPMVPRISPEFALELYRSNGAVFFGAGNKDLAIFPGVTLIYKTKHCENPPVKKLNAMKKMIVIYCH